MPRSSEQMKNDSRTEGLAYPIDDEHAVDVPCSHSAVGWPCPIDISEDVHRAA
jgi:hypothetical protein